MSRGNSLPPLKVRVLDDPPLRDKPESFEDQASYNPNTPIAIDFGSSKLRAGYVDDALPSHIFPNRLTRYRDRKLNRTMTFIGNDTSLDQAVRVQAKTPFDGSLVTNWDYVEDILEYTFNHLGVIPNQGVSNPIVINERLATIQSQRANWYQILFECYNVPGVTFGIDSMFAFYENNGPSSTGLVIGCGNEDTSVIPVIDGKGVLTEAKRINWGGSQATEYLTSLMSLKYPYFPTKLSNFQFKTLYEEYCYVSQSYDKELENYLSLDYLEKNNVALEAPFTEVIHPQKTEEELRIQAEKRKESGKRLQEQAKQKRIERMVQKEEELQYYSQVKEQLKDQPKRKVLAILQNSGFDDERDFRKYLYNLERSLKKSQFTELEDGEDDQEQESEHKFELLAIQDEDLNEEQLKEKRKQKLLKASQDARRKAKEEKDKAAQLEEEKRIQDEEWRKNNLQSWIKDKRKKLARLISQRKEKIKIRDEMKDRKSQISQNRMKNLATLAEDTSRGSSKRTRQQATIDNDPNDTFGANDDDWTVYNDISQSPEALEEAIEEEYKEIVALEGVLLEHDPNFTEEDTLDAQYDWRNSILHLFLRGPRPHDSENIHDQHQMHMNIERIRVPEVLFQPNMGGEDQAGIPELCENLLLKKFGSSQRALSTTGSAMAQNTWITGGNAKIPGLKGRIVREFTEFLPSGTAFSVNMSGDPSLDAWRGMAKLARNDDGFKQAFITKKEYQEYGPEYIKEHNLGNVHYFE
ncbi:probable ARP5-Actin-related protein [Zygosaccharomyces bailii ISA1307]|nr:probable ARP5-Actin-related protein [Zygosaccharomyces bailii ISA1307]